ncbi:MAG: UDP-N-acetylglucosamine 4,6-dehydratase (inverting) [Patescibacteria group bacterium]
MSALDSKTILLTGGTGSFGKKFVEIALKEHNPKVIRIFSRDEFKQFEMAQEFNDERLRFLVGDVKDKDRAQRAMDGVDIVIHAAALKQVPSCEYNPFEAVKTNILGSQNIVDASIDKGVEKVICLSTDKAVNPVSLYGATKLCAEKLFVQGNAYSGGRKTKIGVVRYGNVVGSRGSVIPVFKEQKEKGVLTVTDNRMTRFWITQEQAARFVILMLDTMRGGEIFVPKMPSMKLVNLALAIAPEAQIKIIGIRPGEKIGEALLTLEESRHSKEFDTHFVIEPEFPFWEKLDIGGQPLPEGFSYSSDNNVWELNKDDLQKMLDTL